MIQQEKGYFTSEIEDVELWVIHETYKIVTGFLFEIFWITEVRCIGESLSAYSV